MFRARYPCIPSLKPQTLNPDRRCPVSASFGDSEDKVGLPFGVEGLCLRVSGVGFQVCDSGFGCEDLGSRMWGSGCWVQGVGCRLWCVQPKQGPHAGLYSSLKNFKTKLAFK